MSRTRLGTTNAHANVTENWIAVQHANILPPLLLGRVLHSVCHAASPRCDWRRCNRHIWDSRAVASCVLLRAPDVEDYQLPWTTCRKLLAMCGLTDWMLNHGPSLSYESDATSHLLVPFTRCVWGSVVNSPVESWVELQPQTLVVHCAFLALKFRLFCRQKWGIPPLCHWCSPFKTLFLIDLRPCMHISCAWQHVSQAVVDAWRVLYR